MKSSSSCCAGSAAGVLRRQQRVEVEVGAVRHRPAEVGGDALLEDALGSVDGVIAHAGIMPRRAFARQHGHVAHRRARPVGHDVEPARSDHRERAMPCHGRRTRGCRRAAPPAAARPVARARPWRGHAAAHAPRPAAAASAGSTSSQHSTTRRTPGARARPPGDGIRRLRGEGGDGDDVATRPAGCRRRPRPGTRSGRRAARRTAGRRGRRRSRARRRTPRRAPSSRCRGRRGP